MRWRIITKQYGAEIHYIQGKKIAADTLNRLGLDPSTKSEPNPDINNTPKTRKLEKYFLMTQGLTRLNITSTKEDYQYKQSKKPKYLAEMFASTTKNEQ